MTSNTPPDAVSSSSGNVIPIPIQQYPNTEPTMEQQSRQQENVYMTNNVQTTIEANVNEQYHPQQQLHHHPHHQNPAQNLIPNDIQYAHVEQNMINASGENGFAQIHPDHQHHHQQQQQQQQQHEHTGVGPVVNEQPILTYQNVNMVSANAQQQMTLAEEQQQQHQSQIQHQQQQQQQLQPQYQNTDPNQQQQQQMQMSDGGQSWQNNQAIDQNISNQSEISQPMIQHQGQALSQTSTATNESNVMQTQAQNYPTHQIQIADQTTQLNATTPPEAAQTITTTNLIQQQQQQQQPSFTQQQQNEIQPTVANTEHSSNVTSSGAKTQQSGEGRTRRSNKSSERIPKLVILSVQNGTLVDCSMESKLKTIKFKFDISDVNPIDVANDLVSFKFTLYESKSLLGE